MKATNAIVTAVFLAGAGAAHADIYHDQASFDSEFATVHLNTFDDVVAGPAGSLSYDDGTYAYTVTTISQDGVSPAHAGLFNYDGYTSAESGIDGILITFTGASVYAFGGNIWCSDGQGANIGGYLLMTISDGQTEQFSATGPSNFRGFSSSVAITSVFLDIPGDNLWVTMDNLRIGAVPAPGAGALLALGSLAVSRRRRV